MGRSRRSRGRASKNEDFDPNEIVNKVDVSDTEDMRSPNFEYDIIPDQIKNLPYFHGFIPKKDATDMVIKVGDFLLRRCDEINQEYWDRNVSLILTIRINTDKDINEAVKHILLARYNKHGAREYYVSFVFNDAEKALTALIDEKLSLIENDLRYVPRHPVSRQDWLMHHDKLIYRYRMGIGSFGEVWYGLMDLGDERYLKCALKRLKNKSPETRAEHDDFVAEASVMRQLDHKNIVKFRGIAMDENPMTIVMEWCSHGSVARYLTQRGVVMPLELRLKFSREAAEGLEYLERNKVVHCDIAARNCMLDTDKTLKIGDFGLALIGVPYGYRLREQYIRTMAPECIKDHRFTHKSDVWAYAVLLYEIFTNLQQPYRKVPYQNFPEAILGGLTLEIPPLMPPSMQKLLKKCQQFDPQDRPDFKYIKRKMHKIYRDYSGTNVFGTFRSMFRDTCLGSADREPSPNP